MHVVPIRRGRVNDNIYNISTLVSLFIDMNGNADVTPRLPNPRAGSQHDTCFLCVRQGLMWPQLTWRLVCKQEWS